jgi:hypothetical protein
MPCAVSTKYAMMGTSTDTSGTTTAPPLHASEWYNRVKGKWGCSEASLCVQPQQRRSRTGRRLISNTDSHKHRLRNTANRTEPPLFEATLGGGASRPH